ncbi:6115_t:CDS:2 [Diversispora eburnea]|uniref:Ribosome biogenesis regulatory protein n=1 Tax=Diversispora eburnea TaxID=1213867 RepID=A0A9N9FA52_9GLOM|nr:6115_t:CDS:2 [Diversispora eburnea]
MIHKDLLISNTADEYLKEYTRDGTQLLINQIFQSSLNSSESGIAVTLPDPITAIPREKPIPKPKPLTRWEKFAKAKGIHHRKKDKLIFDKNTGEWVPRWGYKGTNHDGADDWLIPVPDNTDQFANRREVKKQRISKNEARHPLKEELQKTILMSKTSTASNGKFDKVLEGEPKIKGVKRKFEPNVGDTKKEKETNLNILNKLIGKNDSVLNVRKAITKINQ